MTLWYKNSSKLFQFGCLKVYLTPSQKWLGDKLIWNFKKYCQWSLLKLIFRCFFFIASFSGRWFCRGVRCSQSILAKSMALWQFSTEFSKTQNIREQGNKIGEKRLVADISRFGVASKLANWLVLGNTNQLQLFCNICKGAGFTMRVITEIIWVWPVRFLA